MHINLSIVIIFHNCQIQDNNVQFFPLKRAGVLHEVFCLEDDEQHERKIQEIVERGLKDVRSLLEQGRVTELSKVIENNHREVLRSLSYPGE